MSVVVMVCFARSGGTLLNRCLGCLPNVVILSEVNPLGGGWGTRGPASYITVKDQAKHWYGIDIQSDDFAEGIAQLYEACEEHGQHLIIRDWSFVNFAAHGYNMHSPPRRFLTLEALAPIADLRTFVLVRDSIDVWISRGRPSMLDFYDEYLAYVGAVVELGVPIFKYEEFCSRPDQVMRDLCECTNLRYSPSYRRYEGFTKVNGDSQNCQPSRGVAQGMIRPLPRAFIPKDRVDALNRCEGMIRANQLLGYPTTYHGGLLDQALYWLKALERSARQTGTR